MMHRFFYVKTTEGLGLDLHGRATDNVRMWHIYADSASALRVAYEYGHTVGIL